MKGSADEMKSQLLRCAKVKIFDVQLQLLVLSRCNTTFFCCNSFWMFNYFVWRPFFQFFFRKNWWQLGLNEHNTDTRCLFSVCWFTWISFQVDPSVSHYWLWEDLHRSVSSEPFAPPPFLEPGFLSQRVRKWTVSS